ncbi:GTPase [Photobacterium iliopiscarium]|jgi:G3E family GTPase|uniref:GTP-binding protein n=1 Tax=Photobacterium iliopiscarium TaxID=56192 RepID=A0A0D8PP71_9GAMM|nr:GTP-binding protein [Photobacterium iliopiscarium]KJG20716.1 GTPase [Photobacterium iliopiscarium]MCD9467319.1 GTP-binding protein [Photobacterium iliopiscarium]MCD9487965.1 GTP-binding protein [Photobacterium iliopiscarium]MCF2244779.1 GTP-binding protein [Photobacterium iliopiscarium]PSV99829.1 GTP-binding protein [Photobacterium iliopiscarium]
MKRIPTNIITGFLGAGKTTAILSLLSRKPEHEKWAILINEFGNVGVDGAILEQQGAIIKEVPGGCMCCVAGLPMSVGINALLAQKPDRLLLEPTGLGHPKEVIHKLTSESYRNYVDLRATITVVDPRHFAESIYTDNINFQDQLALADVVVANKIDQCDDFDLYTFQTAMEKAEPQKALIAEVEHGRLELEWLDIERTDRQAQHSHHHGHDQAEPLPELELAPGQQFIRKENHGQGYHSCGWFFAADQLFEFSKLFSLFSNLSANRIKAVVNTENGCFAFNVVNQVVSVNELSLEGFESRIEVIDSEILPWDELENILCSITANTVAK